MKLLANFMHCQSPLPESARSSPDVPGIEKSANERSAGKIEKKVKAEEKTKSQKVIHVSDPHEQSYSGDKSTKRCQSGLKQRSSCNSSKLLQNSPSERIAGKRALRKSWQSSTNSASSGGTVYTLLTTLRHLGYLGGLFALVLSMKSTESLTNLTGKSSLSSQYSAEMFSQFFIKATYRFELISNQPP